MELTKKDRILLINQYRILAGLYKDDETHYEELIGILENGYEIFYSKIDEWISEDMPLVEGRLVLDILDVYRAIEDIKRSTKNQDLTEHHYSIFRGFDGNNESKYMGFCRFLIEKQGKFREQEQYLLRNDNFNSHMPMIAKYQRMVSVANEIPNMWNMTVEDALRILNA